LIFGNLSLDFRLLSYVTYFHQSLTATSFDLFTELGIAKREMAEFKYPTVNDWDLIFILRSKDSN
jgi:hypothetical protein